MRQPLELPLEVLDSDQVPCTAGFIRFRDQGRPHPAAWDDLCSFEEARAAWDLETITRASRMLLADRSAPLTVRAMGMTERELDDWDPVPAGPGDPF